MTRHAAIAPKDVHSTLARHMLVDGYPMVVDLVASRPQWVRDAITGKDYLDFFSFFASNPLGINHPKLMDEETKHRLLEASINKVSNPDCYTTLFAEFVDVLGRTACAPDLPHYFFIDGGALAVENAMKTAFDWKVRKNMAAGRGQLGSRILHFEHAFHTRCRRPHPLANNARGVPFAQVHVEDAPLSGYEGERRGAVGRGVECTD